MIVKELQEIPNIKAVSLGTVETESIDEVAVSELMSDVLTMEHENLLLITGLCTDQAIRTADIMGAVAIIITQGKQVTPSMITIATESGMALFTTNMQNFDVCQHLCSSGEFPLR